ncbi:hypothetical protein MAR_032647, partial [Mya arenaria]
MANGLNCTLSSDQEVSGKQLRALVRCILKEPREETEDVYNFTKIMAGRIRRQRHVDGTQRRFGHATPSGHCHLRYACSDRDHRKLDRTTASEQTEGTYRLHTPVGKAASNAASR